MLQILEPDIAAKLSDHITRYGQSEAGSATLGLGGEERFEDLVAVLAGYARA